MPKVIPFDFVFDYLPHNVVTKSMFGMQYIYLGTKLMLMLRKSVKEVEMNGVWVATAKEHHQSLEKDIPAMVGYVLDNGEIYESNWRLIKDDRDDFEEAAIKVCELIARSDPRIGKLTKKAPL
ncbi:hypothetical protein [Mucilaginibacter ginsenosidivorans]|uniref:Uncharacterized protein n=1 Tax=Mucilaginibacter ginsenosidivorans TaxID=398053 RepID=A0A5B8UYL0_9SPHI|nr:hypothetical protein [Mucilaginibacter ginsenosidivorans]QEC64099.1 hypothetical protein FRZ54_16450 [Mucilaginibacter ginsenosidivorans]